MLFPLIFHKSRLVKSFLAFLIIGIFGYVVLISLIYGQVIYYSEKEVLQDFKDIQKMFKYLTFSAGSNALAVSCCLLGYNQSGLILGLIGVISTILLTYTLFCTLFFHIQVPIQTISPFWLLLAIACNSSGIVITTLWEKGMLINHIFLLLAFLFLDFWSFYLFDFHDFKYFSDDFLSL